MRNKLVLWFTPVNRWICCWIYLAVSQTAATATGIVCLDKTVGILSLRRTTVAASRHGHDDVSGSDAKELRQGRGALQGVF